MATKNFTFKLYPKETGLAAVGNDLQSSHIKFDKKVCGTIKAPNWMSKTNDYIATLAVKHNDPDITHCDWHWITLNIKDPDLQVVKDWIKAKSPAILAKYTLHFFDDED